MRNIIAVFTLLICLSGYSQNFGEIKGLVKDGQGAPVYTANVWVNIAGNITGTTTDKDGRFTLKPLEPGIYTLHIKYIEFAELQVTDVEVFPNEITFKNELVLDQTNTIAIITVVGHRDLIKKDNPSLMQIGTLDIARSAAATDQALLISSTVPGVKLSDDGQQLYFRGSRPQNVSTFIDGVKLPASGIPNIPRGAIKNISVYTGGVPAKYGDVTGGVISYETKSYMDLWNERQKKLKQEEEIAG